LEKLTPGNSCITFIGKSLLQEMVSSTLFMSEENRFFDSPEVNHQNEGRRSWISCPRAVYLESDLNICRANSHGGTTYW